MFTRQHYKAIAEMISELSEDIVNANGEKETVVHKGRLVSELARFFARDNERFSRERFEDACKRRATMYRLVLTKCERDAFDWVGNRYSNGDDMRRNIEPFPVNAEDSWDSTGDVAFDLPEYAAWDIAILAKQDEGLFPCFAWKLAEKMRAFIDAIV
jgi:hypothetical protein